MFAANEALNWVKNELADCERATLAVAFWGAGAVEALGLETERATDRDVHIICNLAMGGTNPREVERLLGLPNVRVSQCDTLHAKIYLFPGAAMVGSSNVSANGLSFEGPLASAWHEANLVTRDRGTLGNLSDWIEELPVRDISATDLAEAKRAWKARRKARAAKADSLSIAELLDQGPSAFEGLDLYLTLTAGDLTDEADQAVNTAKQEHPEIDAWEDWDALPDVGTFVSFAEEGGAFKYEDCYLRLPDVPDRPEADGKYSLQWCFQTNRPLGLKSPGKDRAHWRRILELVIDQHGNPAKGDAAVYVSFEELAKLWLRSKAA